MRSARARLSIAALAAAALLLTGCGARSADLFAVERSGSIPGAKLTLVVNDGGTVTCDSRSVDITDKELLDARAIEHDLEQPAQRGLRLRPVRGTVLRYRVLTSEGTLSFADNSHGKPPVLDRLVFYVLQIARRRCGRAR